MTIEGAKECMHGSPNIPHFTRVAMFSDHISAYGLIILDYWGRAEIPDV